MVITHTCEKKIDLSSIVLADEFHFCKIDQFVLC